MMGLTKWLGATLTIALSAGTRATLPHDLASRCLKRRPAGGGGHVAFTTPRNSPRLICEYRRPSAVKSTAAARLVNLTFERGLPC
jgi:hypothetical protein